jgi:hypothetical protein
MDSYISKLSLLLTVAQLNMWLPEILLNSLRTIGQICHTNKFFKMKFRQKIKFMNRYVLNVLFIDHLQEQVTRDEKSMDVVYLSLAGLKQV